LRVIAVLVEGDKQALGVVPEGFLCTISMMYICIY
jgi:hypothetical protein